MVFFADVIVGAVGLAVIQRYGAQMRDWALDKIGGR